MSNQNERDHMNAAQEEIERLKESLRLLQAQYCRVIDPLLEDDGETPKYKAENERLSKVLREFVTPKREHYECEDAWYSCPKHEGYAKDDGEDGEDECNCGADEHNAKLEYLLNALAQCGSDK